MSWPGYGRRHRGWWRSGRRDCAAVSGGAEAGGAEAGGVMTGGVMTGGAVTRGAVTRGAEPATRVSTCE